MSKPVIVVFTNPINSKRKVVNEIIDAQKGKFFTVDLTTKTNQREISINGRTGVTKFLKGGKGASKGASKGDLRTVFNVKRMDYRSAFIDGVSEIRANGVVYKFV